MDKNREYIEEYADHFGWYLYTIRTKENYEELVKKYGFPGPSKHVWFYQYLKERQIGDLATLVGTDQELHCWTGVHKAESVQRMKRVEDEQEDQSGRWTWHAPCAEWSQSDFDEYFESHDIPENELWTELGRSGDCFCGAYGNRMELLDVDAIGGDVAEWIREIEDSIDMDTVDFDDPRRAKWAWHDDDPTAWAIEDSSQMMLCANCGPAHDSDEREVFKQ
jgi:hypothetical protein